MQHPDKKPDIPAQYQAKNNFREESDWPTDEKKMPEIDLSSSERGQQPGSELSKPRENTSTELSLRSVIPDSARERAQGRIISRELALKESIQHTETTQNLNTELSNASVVSEMESESLETSQNLNLESQDIPSSPDAAIDYIERLLPATSWDVKIQEALRNFSRQAVVSTSTLKRINQLALMEGTLNELWVQQQFTSSETQTITSLQIGLHSLKSAVEMQIQYHLGPDVLVASPKKSKNPSSEQPTIHSATGEWERQVQQIVRQETEVSLQSVERAIDMSSIVENRSNSIVLRLICNILLRLISEVGAPLNPDAN